MRTFPEPPTAEMSRSLLAGLLAAVGFNAISGFGLWLAPGHVWRTIHGWSAPLILVMLGVVGYAHALRGWQLRKNVASGCATAACFLALTITGWMLYYSGDDVVRKIASAWHTALGAGSLAVLALHAFLGRRGRTRTRNAPRGAFNAAETSEGATSRVGAPASAARG